MALQLAMRFPLQVARVTCTLPHSVIFHAWQMAGSPQMAGCCTTYRKAGKPNAQGTHVCSAGRGQHAHGLQAGRDAGAGGAAAAEPFTNATWPYPPVLLLPARHDKALYLDRVDMTHAALKRQVHHVLPATGEAFVHCLRRTLPAAVPLKKASSARQHWPHLAHQEGAPSSGSGRPTGYRLHARGARWVLCLDVQNNSCTLMPMDPYSISAHSWRSGWAAWALRRPRGSSPTWSLRASLTARAWAAFLRTGSLTRCEEALALFEGSQGKDGWSLRLLSVHRCVCMQPLRCALASQPCLNGRRR